MRQQNSNTGNNATVGCGWFTSVLTLVFITLKLLNKIDWSWWWVLSPMWICLVITLIVVGATVAVLFYKNRTAKEESPI